MRLIIYVNHPYKTPKMSQNVYSYFIGYSYRDYVDLSFNIKSSHTSELFVEQSHFKVGRLL